MQIPKFVSKRITDNSCNEDIFVKVLHFTIQYYRTVDLMRTSNTAQKNRCHQEEGRTVPETSYGTILLSAEM